mgnify:CR=1 FL=1
MTDAAPVPVLLHRLDPDLPVPGYAHPGDAGADLHARTDVTLGPGARALVATGGETARALLTAMGVPSLRLVDEVERGVPRAVARLATPLPIVTKAGAFGDRQTLVRSRAALRNTHQ